MGRKNRPRQRQTKHKNRSKNKRNNSYSNGSGELVQLPNAQGQKKFRTRGPQAINDLAIEHFGSRYYCVGERKRIEQENNTDESRLRVAKEPDGSVDGEIQK